VYLSNSEEAMNIIDLENISKQLILIGKKVYERGYVDANGGNLSARVKQYIIIKRSGASLANLTLNDFIIGDISSEELKGASIDYKIHRAIYLLRKDCKCVIHAHPIYTTAISLLFDKVFKPLDFESKYYFGEVPIISCDHFKLHDIINSTPKILNKGVFIEKGHGVYAFSNSFSEAFYIIERLEHAAIIAFLKMNELHFKQFKSNLT